MHCPGSVADRVRLADFVLHANVPEAIARAGVGPADLIAGCAVQHLDRVDIVPLEHVSGRSRVPEKHAPPDEVPGT